MAFKIVYLESSNLILTLPMYRELDSNWSSVACMCAFPPEVYVFVFLSALVYST